eukprot:TRINITY_DN4222_c0_g1_i4.p1 TRINITY_DN4222_c0_g1~~TRINITY_DN4222_c0_g1_i4.p1  ORF type:complete len:311 (-),score=91.08 TRINITY_DN4222_c0_g1_i4:62-994(-)
MGNLLSGPKQEALDVFVDFNNPSPTEQEADLFNKASEKLNLAPEIIIQLQNYIGCGELIRKSITDNTEEAHSTAWEAIVPHVNILKDFYLFSTEIDSLIRELITAVAVRSQEGPESLLTVQSLTKQICQILNFILQFDDLKMSNAGIQNDFSYYRRQLSKFKINNRESELTIDEELANRMSLFYAYPTPMTKCIVDVVTTAFPTSEVQASDLLSALSNIANICYSMVEKKKYTDDEMNLFCLRAMTACIVLFDHVAPEGAFVKKSPIHIKPCVNTLKARTDTSNLINTIKFTSKHFNDPETPANITALLS